ncbi:uncharacterized protein LOC144059343 [Vanacampus margaritifer]
MSELSNPPDSQALLQSMLERLKLQPGRERHAHAHAGEPLPPAPKWGRDGVESIENHKKQQDELTNGYVYGVPAKGFGVSLADSTFNPKDGERSQSGHGCEHYKGHFFFSPQKDNNHMGVNLVSENVTLPQISNASTGQHSAKALPSLERADAGVQRDDISGNNDQHHEFKHNVNDWSWGSTDFTVDNQRNKSFHDENGGFGDLSKWRDMQMVPHKDSMIKRKQRSSENKARRWTEKLKERWLERPGKKGKDESKEDGMNMSSAQSRLINTFHQDAEATFPSLGSSEYVTAQSADDTTDAFIRSSDDFHFGFSTVSLLEEIVSGQEWAPFLNTTSVVSSTNRRTPKKTLSILDVTPKPDHTDAHQWSFRGSESLPDYTIPDAVDLPEAPSHNNTAHSEADQPEPMEQGQGQPHVQSKQSGIMQPKASYVERADILDDSPPTSRVNRKRQHHSAETSQMGWRREGQQDELPNSHEMDDAEEYRTNGSSVPAVPSHSLCGPAPRGVLRHSASQNSDSSWESKRRRVEPNRRVRFAEAVQEIPPLEVDLDPWDSEEEYGTELGFGSEEEEDDEHTATEEEKEVPARRLVLPAWIRALKKKNTGRKRR